LAKKARVWTGTEFVELASAQTDLTAYSTTAQVSSIYSPISTTGLVLITSQTIGTSVTSVTVNNAFSATYDNYLVTIAGGAATGNINLNMVLGSTTTGYYFNASGGVWATSAANTVVGNNASNFAYVGTGRTTGLNMSATINSPFLAVNTTISNPFIANDASYSFNGILANTTSYTAFTLAGGTLTGGTIRVYGYKN